MTDLGDYSREVEVALKLQQECIPIAIRSQEQLNTEQIQEKSDGTVVSICDFALQCIIMDRIKKEFPGDFVFGEEDMKKATPEFLNSVKTLLPEGLNPETACADAVRSFKATEQGPGPHRCWVIDPIDGTAGFVKKDHYAVAMALLIDRQPVCSIVGWPSHKPEFSGVPIDGPAIFVAVKNHGTYAYDLQLNVQPCLPLQVKPPQECSLCSNFKIGQGTALCRKVAAECGITKELLMVSMTKGFILAMGRANLYIRVHFNLYENAWDIAPFSLFVEEMGGICSTIEGTPIVYGDEGQTTGGLYGLVFTMGGQEFHDKVRSIYKEHIREFFPLLNPSRL